MLVCTNDNLPLLETTKRAEPSCKLNTDHTAFKMFFFATPHVRSGCLYPLSCMMVDGSLKMTFHPMSPVVSAETFGSFLRWDILFYSRSFGLEMFFTGHLDHSLVPVLFLAGNALFIGAFAASQQIRTTINIAAVAAFMAYTGAGTEGAAG